jgi:hypothetical protein
MTFDISRIRPGDWLALGGSILLFLSLFFLDWYGISDTTVTGAFGSVTVSGSANGWDAHEVLRWFMLATIVFALVLFVMRGLGRDPGWSVAPSAVLAALAAVTTLLVAFRVLIDEPGPNELIGVEAGAYLGVLFLIAITAGAYLNMGDEATAAADQPPAAAAPTTERG